MPSLNARRAATEAIRAKARASLALAAGKNPNGAKPVISLFAPERRPMEPTLVNTVPPILTGFIGPLQPSRWGERFRWRKAVTGMFARRYKTKGKPGMELAHLFAYNHRELIADAFDSGRFKADVMDELGAMFGKTEVAQDASMLETPREERTP